ncbi:MAG: amino acid aminotransferase [Arsenophonus sp.]|nr:MAG: amino acid aminotransferase [Arsenophonus sp.]
MFEKIKFALQDPIIDLLEKFNLDQRKEKINLGIGIYKNEFGKTPILESVKKAEKYLLENEVTKNYLNIIGIPNFCNLTQNLLLGKNNPIIKENRARTSQTPGGTSALRIIADFLSSNSFIKRVWISNPTWPNHNTIFKNSGLEICQYNYYDSHNHNLNFEKMLNSLKYTKFGDVLLLHGCCHNPTGIDPTPEQWKILSLLAEKKKLLPIFDFAYQGFSTDLYQDTLSLRIFAKNNPEIIVLNSYSKNFSLYNERVGSYTIIAKNSVHAENVLSQTKLIIRSNYSNPPSHGAAIVSTILSNKILKKEWIMELTSMRNRIKKMRRLLVKNLKERSNSEHFDFIKKQNGMFSFTDLDKHNIERLRKEYGIYLIDSGRINIAALTSKNIPFLCDSIISVTR